MSRPNITDHTIDGLSFARACVRDQQVASHTRKDHSWDDRYRAALSAIDYLVEAHAKSTKVERKR